MPVPSSDIQEGCCVLSAEAAAPFKYGLVVFRAKAVLTTPIGAMVWSDPVHGMIGRVDAHARGDGGELADRGAPDLRTPPPRNYSRPGSIPGASYGPQSRSTHPLGCRQRWRWDGCRGWYSKRAALRRRGSSLCADRSSEACPLSERYGLPACSAQLDFGELRPAPPAPAYSGR